MREFVEQLRQKPQELQDELRGALKLTGADAERRSALYANARMRTRSGRLLGSIAHRVIGRPDDIAVEVYAGRSRTGRELRYAATQEEGATITGSPWLTIPFGNALTGAGVPRRPSIRHYDGIFFVRKDGKLYAGTEEHGLLFRLVKSVTIEGKHYMRDGVGDAVQRLPDRITAAVRRVLRLDGGTQ